MIFEILQSNITNIGLGLVAIWIVYKEYKSGSSALVHKMLSDYKERNGQLEEILKNERAESENFKNEMKKVVIEYKKEIEKLHALNDEKDKHNAELKALLQDKNPEVLEVLKEIRDFLKVTDEQNAKVLQNQTDMLTELRERSKKVDEASIKHEGEPMLVPAEKVV